MKSDIGLRERRVSESGVLYLCLFVVMAGFGSTLIVLPSHVQRIGAFDAASPSTIAFHVGLLTGVYAFAQLVAGPIVGRLVDQFGPRRSLLAGLVCLSVTQGVFGLTGSLLALYVIRFVGGVAAASVIVAATTWVTACTTPAGRTRGMAWFGTSVSLGLVVGPAIAGLLSRPEVDVSVGPVRIDGYSIPFLFSALLTLSTAAYSRNRIDEHPTATTSTTSVDSATTQAARPRLATLLGFVATSQFGLALFEGTFVTYSRTRLIFNAQQTSTVFVVCGAVMAVLQVPASRLLAKVGSPLSHVALGFVLMGVGVGGLVPSRSYPIVLIAVAVLATGAALVIPNLSALVSLGSRTSSGVALGWKSSVGSAGQFLGPVVGGSLVVRHTNVAFLLAGALMLTTSATILAGRPLSRRRAPSPPTAPANAMAITLRVWTDEVRADVHDINRAPSQSSTQ